MKFCYYLGAIGNPNLSEKLTILINNLENIYKQIGKFDMIMCIYEENYSIPENILENIKLFVENLYIYEKKGILAELWLTNPHNNLIPNYDYVTLILDDVKCDTCNFLTLIEKLEKYELDIISPAITGTHYVYMNSQNKNVSLSFTNFLEMFCFIMTPTNFQRYLSMLDINNPWIWGVDLVYNFFDIKTGIDNENVAFHIYANYAKNETNDLRRENMNKYLLKFGLNSLEDALKRVESITKIILKDDNIPTITLF